MIPADDRGLLLGDGLFETLLAEDGELVDLGAHLDRMAAGCATLGLAPLDRAGAEQALREALAGVGGVRAAVRLTLTAGSGGRGLDRPALAASRLLAAATPSPAAVGPARLALSSVRRNEGSPASRLKTLAYLDNVLARDEARAQGADEAVMLNNRGEVACAAAANLFWIADGALFTPALACGVLDGVLRGRVMACARSMGFVAHEVAAPVDVLRAAEAVFLTNSLIGVRAVVAMDATTFGPSALVDRLSAALA